MNFTQKVYRNACIAALAYMICWGAILSLFPLKPFWRDEWCMLHNIKFKTAAELWGPLDFTQQFPRVYLQIVKGIAAAFDYSYISLRLPSFLVGAAAVLLAWNLGKRIFGHQPQRYLFILVIAGNPMFIDYMGQVKHYEMEMLMALVALWQYLAMLQPGEKSAGRTALLYTSLAAAPFFSYTYPIAIAPALLLSALAMLKNGPVQHRRLSVISYISVSAAAIAVFYVLDVSLVLRDTNMHNFWFQRPDYLNGGLQKRSTNIWLFFAKTGAGAVFEYVFGVACLAATIHATWRLLKNAAALPRMTRHLLQYSLLLVAALIALYFLDKIPLGQAKFSIFAAPALSLVLAFALARWLETKGGRLPQLTMALLFAAMTGNILTAFLQIFTSEDYRLKWHIYQANTKALKLAQKERLPIVVTPSIGRPDDITVPVPFLSMPDAAGILKTYPAYRLTDTVTIVATNNTPSREDIVRALPAGTKRALLSDGTKITTMKLQ